MAAFAFVPMRPMAIEQMFRNVRLYFVFFFFSIAFAVAIVIFTIGINSGRKRDRLSVWRPFHDVRAGREMRQWLRLAAIHRQEIDLRIAAARRKKRNRLSVR